MKVSLVWFVSVMFILEGYQIKGCLQNERDALLQLNSYFSSIPSYGSNWVIADEKSDCCKWERVKCSPSTGRVTHLYLDDIVVRYEIVVGGISVGWTLNMTMFHPFQELRVLDLYSNWIGSLVQSEGLGNLKKSLRSLDLRFNGFHFIPDILWNLSSLRSLDLTGCSFLTGKLDARVCQLRKIRTIYLYNEGEGEGLNGALPECVFNLTSLQALDLSNNSFSGNLPSPINLPSLQLLSIEDNHFQGKFSLSFLANHSSLEVLWLSNNALQIEIGESLSFSTTQLQSLDLANCNLSVHTKALRKLLSSQSNLQNIHLSGNNLVGSFPTWLLQNNSELIYLFLENNSLTGGIQLLPQRGNLSLQVLDISNNQFSGKIPNKIGMTLSTLEILQMSGNFFQGQIPYSLGNLTQVSTLDLSNNMLFGEVPKRLFTDCVYLNVLALSNNSINGEIIPSNMSLSQLYVLYLDGNRFSGTIDESLMNLKLLTFLDISNNEATGELPSWIGSLSDLQTMSLARNQFHGNIPSQICNLSGLYYLDLSGNRFTGNIPSCGCPSGLRVLHLGGNNLSGPIPKELRWCSDSLMMLDLANNQLSGGIPRWIHKLQRLNTLLLGDNQLQGQLPTHLCQLKYLNIVDVSNNGISGAIPSCLMNLSFGARDGFYQLNIGYEFYEEDREVLEVSEEVYINVKNRYASYKGKMISIMSLLDLSCNQLSGYIPPELGELASLNALNLSHNRLSGTIPGSFSKLKSIESLDLSRNKLSGTIPSQLVDLNFLEVFNVSYNNLSGRVPETWQFGSFDQTNYRGNPLLCGSELPKKCGPKEPPPSSPLAELGNEGDDAFDLEVFFCSFGVSCIIALFTTFMVLYINGNWRRAWFAFIDYHLLWWLY